MTKIDNRDRKMLEAIDHIGPVTPHVLAFHPIEREFDTYDEIDGRLETLAAADYLACRTVKDVSGDSVTEYDTADGWERRLDRADVRGE